MKKQLTITYVIIFYWFGFAMLAFMPAQANAQPTNYDNIIIVGEQVADYKVSNAQAYSYITNELHNVTVKKKNLEYSVFYKVTKPFLTVKDGIPHGKVATIVKNFGVNEHVLLNFYPVNTMEELLTKVETIHNAIGIGAVSIIQERIDRVNFSVPYEFGDISLVHDNSLTLGAMARTARAVAIAFVPLLVAVLIVAILLTFCVKNPTVRRFGNKLWLSLVTGTTTGFDDNGSETTTERVILAIWMIASMFIFSMFNASVYVTLDKQVNDIFSPVKVGVVVNTEGANVCRDNDYVCVEYPNIKTMVKAFKSKQVSSMVYDEAIIKTYVSNVGYKTLKTDMYGIIMNKNCDIYRMNKVIL